MDESKRIHVMAEVLRGVETLNKRAMGARIDACLANLCTAVASLSPKEEEG